MPVKEYKAEKQLYTMGEVTEMFDVKPSLIRFWSERFDVLKPRKNKKGNRLFSPEDVKILETIYHLTKERGMTLAGVDKYLKTNWEDASRETEIVRRLQTVRALLAEIRQELKEGPEEEDEKPVAPVTDFWSDESAVEELRTEAEPEPVPDPEIPDPMEFAEEVLAGEIIDEQEEPFVSEAFDSYTEEVIEEPVEPDEPDAPEPLPDEELSAPFYAQPLFELDDEPAAPQENIAPPPVDTQQSLF